VTAGTSSLPVMRSASGPEVHMNESASGVSSPAASAPAAGSLAGSVAGSLMRVTRSASNVHAPQPMPAPRATGVMPAAPRNSVRGGSSSSSSSGSVMRRASTQSSGSGSSQGSQSEGTIRRSTSNSKPKVVARRPQRTDQVMRQTDTVARSASPDLTSQQGQDTTSRLDELDHILAALEDRVMRALERRGGIHRGWF